VAVKRFDKQLFDLKLHEAFEWLHSETEVRRRKVAAEQRKIGQELGAGFLAKIADSDVGVLLDFLSKVDETCRETWLTDLDSITPEFIRAVLAPQIFAIIAARKGGIHGHLKSLAGRTRMGVTDLQASAQHLELQVRHLESKLSTRYEIEAMELSKQEAPKASAISRSLKSEDRVSWPHRCRSKGRLSDMTDPDKLEIVLTRKASLEPLLAERGFSVHDWAKSANVDFHTANDYLRGKTRPHPSTLKKLAQALGIEVATLPV
jgi:hypothetical protein